METMTLVNRDPLNWLRIKLRRKGDPKVGYLSHSTASSTDEYQTSELRSVSTPVSAPPSLHRSELKVAIVDDRPLMRDCFGRSLALLEPAMTFSYYSNLEDLVDAGFAQTEISHVVLLCIIWSKARADSLISKIAHLRAIPNAPAVVVLSDLEDLNDVSRLIEGGASGYIPNSVNLEVALKAIQLVAAGGIYIPPSILLWSKTLISEISERNRQPENAFTSRQTAVIEALRRGKPNKIIAYELNMCESTVKVHIRNIMKKLKAKNRTEVAYILNSTSSFELNEISK